MYLGTRGSFLGISIFYGILVKYAILDPTCPAYCKCNHVDIVDCSQQNLTGVPRGLSRTLRELDLSMNNITSLPDFAFRDYKNLESLRLVKNMLSSLPNNVFYGLIRLQHLSLEGNRFRVVPRFAFQPLFSLHDISLASNIIEEVPEESFMRIKRLKVIKLEANRLTSVPTAALKHLAPLSALSLSVNKITRIEDYSFQNNTDLEILTLFNNKISFIGDHAFEHLRHLLYLELQRNSINHVPPALVALQSLQELDLAGNRISFVPDRSFIGNKGLEVIKLKGNAITSVGVNAFRDLPFLKELILSEVYDMTVFPNLTGTLSIENLRLDRASIKDIPDNLCENLHNLKVLDMHSNKVARVPVLSKCQSLKQLNLGNNLINSLEGGIFTNLSVLQDLTLSHNSIHHLTATTFSGLSNLEYLDLAFNKIQSIQPRTFSSLKSLTDLNLAENNFPVLPTEGLLNLRKLKTFHNNALQEPINPTDLPNVQILVLSYAYHCCNFRKITRQEQDTSKPKIVGAHDFFNTNKSWYLISPNDTIIPAIPDPIYDDYKYNPPMFSDDFGADYDIIPEEPTSVDTIVKKRPPITCDPQPGPFLPCDDLFGWWSLRCGIWIVFLLAVVGNCIVLFVSITARSKMSMDVPRFLVCNLACADLFMGIYLGMLAIVDASSLGSFQRYAIQWQTSAGCLAAGFLGVISSELSVFTLTVITVERFYAISNALHFNKRLTLRQAGIIMSIGWMFCILNASLPFFGISDYRKFAICLPFETSDRASLAYVCFLMLFNGASFLIIVLCYIKMYCSIMGSNAWNSKDFRIAKRMAILVFTDFLCWAPIIFFTVTSALGLPLIGLNEAKVLTIFVLPLNSCANPFLYAIFTKQFKRDCVKLCKRIEESSISRSLSNMNSRRVSFGSSWRHSQLHSPFHLEKRSSISNSVSGSSVNGNPNNDRVFNGNDAKACSKDCNQFFGRDFDNMEDADEKTPSRLEDKQTDSDKYGAVKQRNLSVGATGSDTQIVIHFDDQENNMLLVHSCDEEDNDNCRKCRVKKTKKVARKQSERTESTSLSDNVIPKQKSKVKDKQEINIVQNPIFDEKFRRRKVKREENDIGFNRIQHVSSAPHVKMPETESFKLPDSLESKDKMSHINEWRKSSHLTYLWRNSLEVEGAMPKYKSNSIAELPRPSKEYDGSPCKRRSLSSRHEGYILLKNNNRDSAYEDEEEMIEYNTCKSWSVEHCKCMKNHTSHQNSYTRRQCADDTRNAVGDECQTLLCTRAKSPVLRKDNFDKESGISSDT